MYWINEYEKRQQKKVNIKLDAITSKQKNAFFARSSKRAEQKSSTTAEKFEPDAAACVCVCVSLGV